jgi:3-hydroxyacyl-[acyl-carrier-protein] dehydratase
MKIKQEYGLDDIQAILPHRPPFLFVDRVIKLAPDKEIIAERTIRDDEPYFAGHFPQKHIMPGVLVTDALAQTSGLLWGLSKKAAGAILAEEPSPVGDVVAPQIFFLASSTMKFNNPSFPGETLTLQAWSERSFGSLFSYSVEATVGRKLVAKGTLTLAMMDDASAASASPKGEKSTPSGASLDRLTRDDASKSLKRDGHL